MINYKKIIINKILMNKLFLCIKNNTIYSTIVIIISMAYTTINILLCFIVSLYNISNIYSPGSTLSEVVLMAIIINFTIMILNYKCKSRIVKYLYYIISASVVTTTIALSILFIYNNIIIFNDKIDINDANNEIVTKIVSINNNSDTNKISCDKSFIITNVYRIEQTIEINDYGNIIISHYYKSRSSAISRIVFRNIINYQNVKGNYIYDAWLADKYSLDELYIHTRNKSYNTIITKKNKNIIILYYNGEKSLEEIIIKIDKIL